MAEDAGAQRQPHGGGQAVPTTLPTVMSPPHKVGEPTADRQAGPVPPYCLGAVAELARWLERGDPPASRRRTPTQRVAAIAWHLRVGGRWRALPAGFPAWRTVSGWFRRWRQLGLFDGLLRAMARLRRRAVGRRPEPSLTIIGTQAGKGIGVRGPRGYDAGKRVLGRKRMALVDAEGHMRAVAVVLGIRPGSRHAGGARHVAQRHLNHPGAPAALTGAGAADTIGVSRPDRPGAGLPSRPYP
jgi:transposase